MRTLHKRYRDAQRRFPAAQCAQCGGEIYPGMPGWRLGGWTFCMDCVAGWLPEGPEVPARRGEVRR